jgi:hypothetical protein
METLLDLEIIIQSESETPSSGPVHSLMRASPNLKLLRLHLKRSHELVSCLGDLPLSVSLRSFSINLLPTFKVTEYPRDNSVNSAFSKCITCMPSLTRFELLVAEGAPELNAKSLLSTLLSSSTPKVEYISLGRVKLPGKSLSIQLGEMEEFKMQLDQRAINTQLVLRGCKTLSQEMLELLVGYVLVLYCD